MTTLLLVDDSVTIQRVIELTFADEGIRVISVSDGESAIARMEAENPDIVLADVGMPNVNGYQVAAHVKGTPALAHVPVLLLTGAFEPIDEQRARHTGCDGVLVKPFEPRQLIAAVRGLLAGTPATNLWPADMPRTEGRGGPSETTPTPIEAPAAPLHLVPPPAEEVGLPATDEAEPDTDSTGAALQAGADSDPGASTPDVAAAPPVAAATDTQVDTGTANEEPTSGAGSDSGGVLPAATAAPDEERPAAPAGQRSLARVFSALLAAERGDPGGRLPKAAASALSEAAVEEVVVRVVTRMTDELVRKTVLETAERLIREEIDRTKSQTETR